MMEPSLNPSDDYGFPPFPANDLETSPLPLEWFCDIEPQLTGLWLIKRLLPALGIVLIYGHPGCGKSFLALDWAFHIALGLDWNGRKVRKGLVVYVGAEGTSGLRNRMVAFRRHYGPKATDGAPLVLIPTPVDLQAANADTPRLASAIRFAIKASGEQPAAIFVDTLSKTFGAGKENTDDMANYVANCQRLATEFACCVIPVHHRPKDAESEEPRGHSSLKGGVDTVVLVEAGKPRRVRLTKQKDAEIGEEIGFNLHSVYLGTDEEGEAVTSCIVELTEGAPPVRTKTGRRLNDGQAIALKALQRATNEAGEDAPSGIPLDILKAGIVARVVKVATWRDQYRASTEAPDTKPDSITRAFKRHSIALQSIGMVQQWEGFVWSTPN